MPEFGDLGGEAEVGDSGMRTMFGFSLGLATGLDGKYEKLLGSRMSNARRHLVIMWIIQVMMPTLYDRQSLRQVCSLCDQCSSHLLEAVPCIAVQRLEIDVY